MEQPAQPVYDAAAMAAMQQQMDASQFVIGPDGLPQGIPNYALEEMMAQEQQMQAMAAAQQAAADNDMAYGGEEDTKAKKWVAAV